MNKNIRETLAKSTYNPDLIWTSFGFEQDRFPSWFENKR